MKPGLFDYIRVTTVDDAIRALESCNDAKVIAGGQSLVPMLNFRMVDTPLFVDINGILVINFCNYCLLLFYVIGCYLF